MIPKGADARLKDKRLHGKETRDFQNKDQQVWARSRKQLRAAGTSACRAGIGQ